MAFPIVGQPGVTAFLQSIHRNLNVLIRMGDNHFLVVNPELNELQELLFGFQDVLVDAERRRFHEASVDKWMDELKDLFYDIDDLIDEIKLEKQQLQQAIAGSTQVCYNFSSSHHTSNSLKYMLGVVLDSLGKLSREGDHLQLKRGAGQHDADWVASQAMVRPKTGSLVDETEIHGREKDKDRIIELLLEDDGRRGKKNYEVICIVGMGGLGKTTLAQFVFQDLKVDAFFAVKSWACVSDVFDVIKVTKDLIESAEKGDSASNLPSSLPALQDRMKKIINGKKVLVVLDDVWTLAKEWDKLKAPLNFCAKGSKILITTRLEKVMDIVSSKVLYQLGRLDDEQCRAIFNDNAFGEIDENDDDVDLMKIGEEIVRKCGGIPLVAKVIGAMLRGKGEGDWKAVKESDLWNLVYEDEDLHPGLRLSYFYLPPSLKRCFEYFALFPSDFKFEQDELVRMWMAEGLIEEKEGIELEEIGSQHYNDLKKRSLIQENDVMHDMIHHLACIVSGSFVFQISSGSRSNIPSLQCVRHASIKNKPELLIGAHKLRTLVHEGAIFPELLSYKRLRVCNFSTNSDLPSSIGYDLKHLRYLRLRRGIRGIGMSGLPDSLCTLTNLQVLDLSYCRSLQNLPQDIGKLSNLRFLLLRLTRITCLPDSVFSLSNLRVLDLFFCEYLTNLPMNIGNPQNSASSLNNLRVLNLSDCYTLSVLPESICNLANLRELDLSGCKFVTTLPNDIGNLQQLQKLKITTDVKLPASIVDATNLHELDVSITNQPAHIGKLTKLEKLSRYLVSKEIGHGINELKDMNKLKGTLRIESMENIVSVEEALMAELKRKKNIEQLEFCWKAPVTRRDGETEVRIIEALEPNTALKSLSFYSYSGHKLPDWMCSAQFHNLTQLIMWDLSITKIEGMVFQSLNILSLRYCPLLRVVSMTTSKLMRLELVKLKELKPAKLVLLPALWDALETLRCDYYHLEHFLQQLKAENLSSCSKLEELTVSFGVDNGITSLPVGWPSILTSLKNLTLENLPATDFKMVSETDQKSELVSIKQLDIFGCPSLVSLESLELPPRLEGLSIRDCRNLKNLPLGLRKLTFLQRIYIWDCPDLEISSHDSLPTSIPYKSIVNCPKLEEQLKRKDKARI